MTVMVGPTPQHIVLGTPTANQESAVEEELECRNVMKP